MKKLLTPILYFFLCVVFFWQFFFKGLLPISADTIVGMYYPFRDIYTSTNPNGIPFKNFLTTDPVRQQYPWRNLSIESFGQKELPIWNPYNFAGMPLLSNLQSASFYPLNLFFLLMPFELAWSFIIFLQPFLAGLFLYLYLKNQKLNEPACFIGAFSFSFSGFFVAWLEWGTILNVALWLPLILLSIDKLFFAKRKSLIWMLVFTFSLIFSFFGGHLQTFFYLSLLTFAYAVSKLVISTNKLKNLIYLLIASLIFLALTIVQWFPLMKLISLSARNVDVAGYLNQGWFVPWQNLIQFVAPDFFGNPTTLNYYGIWNYAEFIGYIGIVPLIFSMFALFFRKDKKTLFFGTIFFLSLIFALPTFIAKLPFRFEIPFLSTSQPTRLLFLTDFALSILAALGLDHFLRTEFKKKILYILSFFALLFIFLWSFVLFFGKELIGNVNIIVARQNLILPSLLFLLSLIIFLGIIYFSKRNKSNPVILNVAILILALITVVDLFRFGWKFETFTKKEYLYPSTSVTTFLKSQKEPFRIMSTDSTILPPNFSIMYKLQTLDGYDPLYIQRYGELMSALGRGEPNINPPFGFNRIITPQSASSKFIDFLNVKYILSPAELKDSKLSLVFKEGEINIYENTAVFPRAFFVNTTLLADSKQESIDRLMDPRNLLNKVAVVEQAEDKSVFKNNWSLGKVNVAIYKENKIVLQTENAGDGFLVLTDTYYPNWTASIDGKKTEIYLTDYNFRGIIVPSGKHSIEYSVSLF